jgi:hypothetical protein
VLNGNAAVDSRIVPDGFTAFFGTDMADKLRLLIPKGRIFDNVARLFAEAGFPITLADRTYRPALGADWLDA